MEPHSVVHSQVVREEAKNWHPIHTHLRTKMRLHHTLTVEVIACVEALAEGEYQPVKRFLGETLFGEIAAGNCSLTGLHTAVEQGTQKLRTEKTETSAVPTFLAKTMGSRCLRSRPASSLSELRRNKLERHSLIRPQSSKLVPTPQRA